MTYWYLMFSFCIRRFFNKLKYRLYDWLSLHIRSPRIYPLPTTVSLEPLFALPYGVSELIDLLRNEYAPMDDSDEIIVAINKMVRDSDIRDFVARNFTPYNIESMVTLCDYLLVDKLYVFSKFHTESPRVYHMQDILPPFYYDKNELITSFAYKNHYYMYEYALFNWNSAMFEVARTGDVEGLKFLNILGCPCNETATLCASIHGHISCLKYLDEINCPIHCASFNTALEHGHYDVMRYIYHTKDVVIEQTHFYSVMKGGNLDCVNFIHKLNNNWTVSSLELAASLGHTTCIEFLHIMGVQIPTSTMVTASQYGHLSTIIYLQRINIPITNLCVLRACKAGKNNIIRYFMSIGIRITYRAMAEAASGGYVKTMKLLHENGCSWHTSVFIKAIEARAMKCVKYAYENGCHWDTTVMMMASRLSDISFIKYLHENGCPWNEGATEMAARYNNYENLKYLHENGCPWDYRTLEGARIYASSKCYSYAIEHNCPHVTV